MADPRSRSGSQRGSKGLYGVPVADGSGPELIHIQSEKRLFVMLDTANQ
jgi:hypothetical protein